MSTEHASDQQRTQERVQRRLAPIAVQARVACPPVRLCRSGTNAVTRYWHDGRLGITIGRRALDGGEQGASDEAIDGILAHELQHIVYDDPSSRKAALSASASLMIALGPVLVLAGLAGGLAAALGATGVGLVLWLFAGVVVGWVAGIKLLTRQKHRRGIHHWHEELRADLAACRLVGTTPVVASLRYRLATSGPRWHRSFSNWLEGTHPPLEQRLAAVTGYDPAHDPDTAATEWLASEHAH